MLDTADTMEITVDNVSALKEFFSNLLLDIDMKQSQK